MEGDDDHENATEVAESDGAVLELERGTPCSCAGAYRRCAALDVRRYLGVGIRRLDRLPKNSNDGSGHPKDVVDYCMIREERNAGSRKTTSLGRFDVDGDEGRGVSCDAQTKTIEAGAVINNDHE